jgi:hypothetical protein
MAIGSRSVILMDHNGCKYQLNNVLYVPGTETAIISMMVARHNGLNVDFLYTDGDEFELVHTKSDFYIKGAVVDNILYIRDHGIDHYVYKITTRHQATKDTEMAMDVVDEEEDLGGDLIMGKPHTGTPDIPASIPSSHNNIWHLRLGHSSATTLSKLSSIKSSYDTTKCDACNLAKAHKSPYLTVDYRAKEKLQLIHSDLCGPLPTSVGESIYFITFTDDYTRFC